NGVKPSGNVKLKSISKCRGGEGMRIEDKIKQDKTTFGLLSTVQGKSEVVLSVLPATEELSKLHLIGEWSVGICCFNNFLITQNLNWNLNHD
ncbi:unnamed protein product, partial [Orchesella dallaii]